MFALKNAFEAVRVRGPDNLEDNLPLLLRFTVSFGTSWSPLSIAKKQSIKQSNSITELDFENYLYIYLDCLPIAVFSLFAISISNSFSVEPCVWTSSFLWLHLVISKFYFILEQIRT